jgi:hypothetical protein
MSAGNEAASAKRAELPGGMRPDGPLAARALVPWPAAAATLLAPVGLVVASVAIPPGVDELPTSDAKTARILDIVASHGGSV